MRSMFLLALANLLPAITLAAQSLYCPENKGYINLGMTMDQVIAACGQPISKKISNRPATVRVPLQQMTFSSLPTGDTVPGNSSVYQMYTLPEAGNMGEQGTLQVDVVDDKVYSVQVNGSSANAMSICNGVSIQIGDPVSEVTNACGAPSLTNTTFIERTIPGVKNPDIWIYQFDQYQPAKHSTFVGGKLQSID